MVWKSGVRKKDLFSLGTLTLVIQLPCKETQAGYVTMGERKREVQPSAAVVPGVWAKPFWVFQPQLPSYWSHKRDLKWDQQTLLPSKELNAQHTWKPTSRHRCLWKERAVLRGWPARRQEARLKSVSPIWGLVKLLWIRGGRLGCGSAGGQVSIGGPWNLAFYDKVW